MWFQHQQNLTAMLYSNDSKNIRLPLLGVATSTFGSGHSRKWPHQKWVSVRRPWPFFRVMSTSDFRLPGLENPVRTGSYAPPSSRNYGRLVGWIVYVL